MCEWCPTVQFLSQSLGKDKDPSANKTKKPSDIRLKHSHSWNQLTPFASSCTSLINSSTLSWIIYVKLTRVYPGGVKTFGRGASITFHLDRLHPKNPIPNPDSFLGYNPGVFVVPITYLEHPTLRWFLPKWSRNVGVGSLCCCCCCCCRCCCCCQKSWLTCRAME